MFANKADSVQLTGIIVFETYSSGVRDSRLILNLAVGTLVVDSSTGAGRPRVGVGRAVGERIERSMVEFTYCRVDSVLSSIPGSAVVVF